MSSPGGPRRPSVRQPPPYLFSACGGRTTRTRKSKEKAKQMPHFIGVASPNQGQQTVCDVCNRQFRRSPSAAVSSPDYSRCLRCRDEEFNAIKWLQGQCAIM